MLIPIAYEAPPDPDIPIDKKGEEYCRTKSRSMLSGMDVSAMAKMHEKSLALERAYAGDIRTQEDIDTFLTDESNNSRNRVMWHANLVKPVVEQMRGLAMQTDYNASVKVISHRAVTRKQVARAELMLMHSASEMSPNMKDIISKAQPIGDTMAQTMGNFENLWDDPYQKAMNHLVEKAAAAAGIGSQDGEDAWHFAFCGMVVNMFSDEGTFIHKRGIHPREFFWDTSAQRLDLSDASYWGVMPQMTFAKILEMWDVPKWKSDAIMDTIRQLDQARYDRMRGSMKIRVFRNYWVDVSVKEYGYILGEGDVPTMIEVGDEDYEGVELIDPPEGLEELFDGKKTRKSSVETLMFCDMVPWEYLMGGPKDPGQKDAGDLVLDYGVAKHQPYNPYDPMKVNPPFCVNVFALAAGEVVSPVQAVLDPDRFVSRILGAMESQLNISGGQTVGVDLDMTEGTMTSTDVDVYRKQGKTIPFYNGGRGISNAIHIAPDNTAQGTYASLQIVKEVQSMVQNITGVHGPMMGQEQKDQLVGVTDMLIKRGMVMQESFLSALTNNKEQQYRYLATAGKEYYLSRTDVLYDMVTDEDLLPLFAGREMSLERANAVVVRDNMENTRRAQANNFLDMLAQRQWISPELYGELYNNSYPEDVSLALRKYNADMRQAQQEAAKQQQKQQMMEGLAAQQNALDQRRQGIEADAQKTADMMAKEAAKEKANVTRENVKAENNKDQAVLDSILDPGQ